MRSDPFVDAALDIKILGNRLDDPVTLSQRLEIILDIARGEERGGGGVHEGGRPGFQGPGDRVRGDPGALALSIGNDIQQQAGHSRVREMRSDSASHRAGPNDRGLPDQHFRRLFITC